MAADMRSAVIVLTLCLLFAPLGIAEGAPEKPLTVKAIRYFTYATFTRVVFETETAAPYVMTRSGDGRSLYFSSYGVPFHLVQQNLPQIKDGVVGGLEIRQAGGTSGIVIHLESGAGDARDFVLRGPDRIVVDIARGAAVQPAPAAGTAPVVVIDPGHGGVDTGIVTGQGVEKMLMLDLASAVRKLLRRAAERPVALLTREQDHALPLDERAAFANASAATVFISLHQGTGSETRVFIEDLDEGAGTAMPAGGGGFLGFDAESEQQQQLWGAQQTRHAAESGRLGRVLARSIAGKDDSEPEQAPLAVLRPVDAAAVMIEVGAGQHRGRMAEAIARGIEQYVREKR